MSVATTARQSPSPRAVTTLISVRESTDAAGRRRLHRQVRRAITAGTTALVVEVPRSQALSSADVATLLWANRRCRQRGGALTVTAEGGADLGLLGSTCLGDVVTITGASTRTV